jgi:amino-acid N-acetyltransferase
MSEGPHQSGRRLIDLREILRYVPRFRDRVFVIAVDGAVVEDENFRNVLLDLALLRSLRVGVVLVHGAAHQLERLGQQMGQVPSNLDGSGVTDEQTLQLALLASGRVSHELLEGLSQADLRGAVTNAVVAHPAGILSGIDHLHTGRVERIDSEMIRSLLSIDMVPVVPPIGYDGEGKSYRLNSDIVAVELARALQATKIVYLTTRQGIEISRSKAAEVLGLGHSELRGAAADKHVLLRQLSQEEASALAKRGRTELPPDVLSKLDQALKAVEGGIPRVHIIDGRVEEGLLAEVFSNEGIGTLIHANEYQAIRRARKKDAPAIHRLIAKSVANDELLKRTRNDIERQAEDFFVFEVDREPVGCVAVHPFPEKSMVELACLCVDPRYENQGIGKRLMQFAENQARSTGFARIFCLSTQTFNFFQQKGGFSPGSPEDLPPARREKYEKSGRKSLVLFKSAK